MYERIVQTAAFEHWSSSIQNRIVSARLGNMQISAPYRRIFNEISRLTWHSKFLPVSLAPLDDVEGLHNATVIYVGRFFSVLAHIPTN